ncbi:hypothetical protein C0560_04635 [Lelliottia sp. AC1]|nr:hypothetical protein C0560_04635 [Lelliottia sp. AC1]
MPAYTIALPVFAIHLLTICCVVSRCKMTCCPERKYSQNRELPEAGRTRPALYGLYEVARCTPLFLPRLLRQSPHQCRFLTPFRSALFACPK